jgi:hypothetical protein
MAISILVSKDGYKGKPSKPAKRVIQADLQGAEFGIRIIAKEPIEGRENIFNIYITGGEENPEPVEFLGSIKRMKDDLSNDRPVYFDPNGDFLTGREAESYFNHVIDDGKGWDKGKRCWGSNYAVPAKGYFEECGIYKAFENEVPLYDFFNEEFDTEQEAIEWLRNPDK